MLRRATGCVVFDRGRSPPRRSRPLAQHGRAGAGLAGLHGRRRHAPAQRLAHRAGRTALTVGDLPMNLVASPDGRFLAISTSGYAKPALSIFDTHTLQVVSRLEVDHTWLGLVWHPGGTRSVCLGLERECHLRIQLRGGRLTAAGSHPARRGAGAPPGGESIANAGYVAGMAISPDGTAAVRDTALRPAGAAPSTLPQRTVAAYRRCCRPSPTPACSPPDGQTLFVSIWGGAKVLVLDAGTLDQEGRGHGRRASQRAGPVARRRAPVRRLRQHQCGVGRGCRPAERDRADFGERSGSRRRSARRPTGWRSHPTAGRLPSPTPTTTR